ncbi:MAG: hypothetical protein RLO17_09565 [Cyclobacteriaceae bacterium]
MKTYGLVLLVISTFIICACENESIKPADIEGTYQGTFNRSSPDAENEPSQVKLTLTNGQFYGESEKIKYPAICSGTYEVKGNKITFFNGCIWTAEFDWSLILSGEFLLESTSSGLTFHRKLGDISDLYELNRK